MTKKKNLWLYAVVIFGLLLMLVLEWQKNNIVANVPYGETWQMIGSRLIGAMLCIVLMCRFAIGHLLTFSKPFWKPLLLVLPCFAIAINNFPILSVLQGDAVMGNNPTDHLMYALLCLSVGLFEEVAFRGCVFTMVLERTDKLHAPWLRVLISAILSSAVFGLVHVSNLFVGANVGYVILQIGYSFLIGGMCAIMLVKTRNLWLCVVLHSVYNFAGGVVPEFGRGQIWTVPTVVLTVIVSLLVAGYVFWLLARVHQQEIDRVLHGKPSSDIEKKETVESW